MNPLGLTLVGCCAEKLQRIAPARQLYRSALFQKAAAYAGNLGHDWMVISAAYGLIGADSQMAPYDVTMAGLTPEQRLAWLVDHLAEQPGVGAHLAVAAGHNIGIALGGRVVMGVVRRVVGAV